MAPIREKLYQCHVQRRRVRAAGGYEFFWKVKSVAEAVVDGDTGFRCMDCHGNVKLYNRADRRTWNTAPQTTPSSAPPASSSSRPQTVASPASHHRPRNSPAASSS